jgi:uncharacterized membrane protein YedE/YeeE
MSGVAVAFLSGLIFAVGLVIGGMTQPAKVVGFLDFTGHWDPSLAMVMFGAIVVYAPLSLLARHRPPVFAPAHSRPSRTDIDWRLITGAALFGIGWGIGGFCPGPAVVALGAGHRQVLVFTLAMAAGMYLYKWTETRALAGGFAPRADALQAAAQGPDS